MSVFQKAREELERRADQTGDGRLDKHDIAVVLQRAENAALNLIDRQGQKAPRRAIAIAIALGALVAGYIAWHARPLFGC